ncbi:MAG: CheR family methyltransferase, partial [Hyphomicrobiaceae bacterium]
SRPISEPRSRRAPIDLFFRSIAQSRGDGIAVLLSGSGSDGALGVKAMKEAGGVILVQEPSDAEYANMPRSAIATGAVDFVGTVPQLAARIAEIVRNKSAIQKLKKQDTEAEVRRILAFLRARTGHDFASYKRNTVMRRIARRMQITRQVTFEAYREFVRINPEEAQELFSDLLISVTSFFRDPAVFEVVSTSAIGPIFDRLGADEPLRAWVVGCATGEEAYSLAILCLEEAQRREIKPQIQIFASDLDEGALSTAREGRYPKSIEADVSEERLRRFFVEDGTHYRIRKEVRDLVLFSLHSALKDPPFIRQDLISCRNLMIYLERDLQRRLCDVFHYALKPGGYLLLGTAEAADETTLFTCINREGRLYEAKPRGRRAIPSLPPGLSQHPVELASQHARINAAAPAGLALAHAAALEEKAPPSAMTDASQKLLHLSPTAGRFIQPSEGAFSAELPQIVRPELRVDLKLALQRAFEHGEPTLTLPSPVAFDGTRRRIAMHVTPIVADKSEARALVLFLDGGPAQPPERLHDIDAAGSGTEIKRLNEALALTLERLSESRKEYESATQELRAANEELQSINEEYRSASEELETSKEELHSMNEELQTVNGELKSKLESISSAHNDLQNLMAATEIGTLFLDPELRIKLFTPAVASYFNITEADIGRAITDFTHRLVYDRVEADAGKVLRDLVSIETEVETKDGRWLMLRLRPYRTTENRIDGIVVTLLDVSARREAESELRRSEERYRSLFNTMDEGFVMAEVVRDGQGRPVDVLCIDANPAAAPLVPLTYKGRRLREIAPDLEAHWWEVPARVVETGHPERCELYAAHLGRWFEVQFAAVLEKNPGKTFAALFQDITERKSWEVAQRRLVDELNHRVKNMLAVVQSIATQTEKGAASTADFVRSFRQRLRA